MCLKSSAHEDRDVQLDESSSADEAVGSRDTVSQIVLR